MGLRNPRYQPYSFLFDPIFKTNTNRFYLFQQLSQPSKQKQHPVSLSFPGVGFQIGSGVITAQKPS